MRIEHDCLSNKWQRQQKGIRKDSFNGFVLEYKADFWHWIVLCTVSSGGGIVPWSHEPINKPRSFPTIQDGNFLSKATFINMPLQIFDQNF